MDDGKIVELYLSRDEAAIAESYAKYGRGLKSIALSVLRDNAAAEECVNDALFEAWRLIPPHEPKEYLFAFLGRITRHIAIDRCRKNETLRRSAVFCELTREMAECIPGGKSTESGVEEGELVRIINAFLKGCSREKRMVFVRRYWYLDSVEDIAKALGFTRGKVKTMLFRMRNELKEYLQKEGYPV